MKLDNMFKKTKRSAFARNEYKSVQERPEVPKGLLKKCPKCGGVIMTDEVENGYYICPRCGGYFHMPALRRLEMIVDADTFEEWDTDLAVKNPMEYKGYPEKIAALKEKTGLDEAVMTGCAKISGCRTVLGICDGRFLMASMGEAVGEKIARAVERATEEKLPVILFACSGGARMQEGIISLMQMAKTSAALRRHSEAGLLYISVLTDPTTGGVTASFAMLGDIILAEPGALIGFAGPRVIEQTIRQKLPKGFQKAEFLLEHGFIDGIVEREKLKTTLTGLLMLHEKKERSEGITGSAFPEAGDTELFYGETNTRKRTPWERVQLSRRPERPSGSAYIRTLFTDFMEMHGDRKYGDDPAVVGGIAAFHGVPVTVIAQEKGTGIKENVEHNFGMPMPEGYRKALRLMKQAEKFRRPVICFVDTPGAFCGMEAEERGQGEAIAENLMEMAGLTVPILTVITGEGGSGGALALAAGDQVWMLENAVYSILSPEGFSSILWKDSSRAKEAAEVMKLTAEDLYRQGMIEKIIPEPEELTEETMAQVTGRLERELALFLKAAETMTKETLLQKRYERFRKF